jgi:branched-chain amino acid transport system ATP-binding protein
MLEVRGVSSGYGRLPVLFDIDFSVRDGEVVAVLGPNGAGKSTLLKTILGVVEVRKGVIGFDGKKISHERPAKRFRRGIALAPEGRRMFSHLTVRENLVSGTYGCSAGTIDAQLERCFELFPRLGERINQRAGSLSGGEQQMLAISRALVSNPRLLLIDELSMGLAPMVVTELYRVLQDLAKQGLAVVVVDQFATKTLGHVDRAYVLEKGRCDFVGAPDEAAERLTSGYMVHV